MAGHSTNIVTIRSGFKCITNGHILANKLSNNKTFNAYFSLQYHNYKWITTDSMLNKIMFHCPPPRRKPQLNVFPTLPHSYQSGRFLSVTSKEPEGQSATKVTFPSSDLGGNGSKVNVNLFNHKKGSFDNMTIGFEAKPSPDNDPIKAANGSPSAAYNENTLVPDFRAIKEFLLSYSDLAKLPSMTRRSPYYDKPYITVYRRKDLEKRAIDKWGSLRNLEIQKKYMKAKIAREQEGFRATDFDSKNEKAIPYEEFNFYRTKEDPSDKKNPYGVVSYAIGFNALNCFLKMGAWLYTGSHSMFAEFIHSVADTANQIILFIGIRKSLKEPDLAHPYGFAKIRNITSLMSGLGIFFVGAGLNIYHGFMGLSHPGECTSLYWALAVLGTSFITEGITLLMALKRLRENSKQANMTLYDYINRAIDPTTNVVLMEDSAAVLGTVIAGTCISIAHFTPHSFADPIGSLLIGTLLGGVASIIISTNAGVLVGRSIPADKRQILVAELEAHKMIRSTIDVKATEVGGKSVKFKAEVDFDGREITKYYLNELNLTDEQLLKEMQELQTPTEAREFMLTHGEGIVDTVGAVIDDIEREFKGKHPEIKYCDLEQL